MKHYDEVKKLFGTRNYAPKLTREIQAVRLTPSNALSIERVSNGTLIQTEEFMMIKFQGLFVTEIVLENEFFVRFYVPGGSYFTSITEEDLAEKYTRLTDPTNARRAREAAERRSKS